MASICFRYQYDCIVTNPFYIPGFDIILSPRISSVIFYILDPRPISIANWIVVKKGTSALRSLWPTLFERRQFRELGYSLESPQNGLVSLLRQIYYCLDLSSTSWGPMGEAIWLEITTNGSQKSKALFCNNKFKQRVFSLTFRVLAAVQGLYIVCVTCPLSIMLPLNQSPDQFKLSPSF